MLDSAAAAVSFPAFRSSPALTIAVKAAFQLATWAGGGSARAALPPVISALPSAWSLATFLAVAPILPLARTPRPSFRTTVPLPLIQVSNLSDVVCTAGKKVGMAFALTGGAPQQAWLGG